ncbi:MAG: hypothetical protein K2F85_04200, partial [Helicobacter sp.]|nr:hypothetical protein [Helicobacter sp.]
MKIAQLTTYPTIMPRHGGQIRAFFLAHCLRYAGHDVRSLALCEPTHAQTARDDVILNKRGSACSSPTSDSPTWCSGSYP